jgi:hypothetical protein
MLARLLSVTLNVGRVRSLPLWKRRLPKGKRFRGSGKKLQKCTNKFGSFNYFYYLCNRKREQLNTTIL